MCEEVGERLQKREEEATLLAFSVHALVPARNDSQVVVTHWPVCTRAHPDKRNVIAHVGKCDWPGKINFPHLSEKTCRRHHVRVDDVIK